LQIQLLLIKVEWRFNFLTINLSLQTVRDSFPSYGFPFNTFTKLKRFGLIVIKISKNFLTYYRLSFSNNFYIKRVVNGFINFCMFNFVFFFISYNFFLSLIIVKLQPYCLNTCRYDWSFFPCFMARVLAQEYFRR